MAVYDLEEQDQLEDLKAWWKQWGNYVTRRVIAVVHRHRRRAGLALVAAQQAEQASVLYGAVSEAVHANDLAKAKEALTQLADKYARHRLRAAGAR